MHTQDDAEPRAAPVQVQRYEDQEEGSDADVLCARCYSLRHHGCVRTPPPPRPALPDCHGLAQGPG